MLCSGVTARLTICRPIALINSLYLSETTVIQLKLRLPSWLREAALFELSRIRYGRRDRAPFLPAREESPHDGGVQKSDVQYKQLAIFDVQDIFHVCTMVTHPLLIVILVDTCFLHVEDGSSEFSRIEPLEG
jgi:hypothetical protein